MLSAASSTEQPTTRARLRDVAAMAGVSVKTASRALNGHPVGADATRRVRDAARALSFRPNGLARDLRRGAVSAAFGLVVGDLANPFYSEIAAAAEHALRAEGLELFLASTEGDAARETRVIRTMLERRVRALFVVTSAADHSWLEPERQLGTPLVFIDRKAEGLAADSIVLDNRAAVRLATQQLLDLGHRRVAVIADSPAVWTARERISAAEEVLAAADTHHPELVVTGAGDVASARAAAEQLLRQAHPPTAILSLNNRITMGVMFAIRDVGIPTALIGVDDFESAELLGVTVLKQSPARMGHRAVELALARLDNPDARPRQVILRAKLIARGSGELTVEQIRRRRRDVKKAGQRRGARS